MPDTFKQFLRLCLFFLPLAGTQFSTSSEARPSALSKKDANLYKKAFEAAHSRNFSLAIRLATKAKNPLPAKAIKWIYLKEPRTSASFKDIAYFLERNPSWPLRRYLIRRAEEKFPKNLAPAAVLSWFEKYPPISGIANSRKAQALIDTGQVQRAKSLLKRAWINKDFGRKEARSFLKKFGKYISAREHAKRLDRLLWDEKIFAARRQLRLVSRERQYLGLARIQLIRRGPGVDYAVRKVPKNLKSDPGLIYDRVRWRRRNGLKNTAHELLIKAQTGNIARPDKWGIERRTIARWALQNGNAGKAYKLISTHDQTDYLERAKTEWLAGWIALRFLSDHDAAFEHFKKMFNWVRFPISRARAAYWAGRAADAGENHKIATQWYKVASTHNTRFYGQLAASHLSLEDRLNLPRQPKPEQEKIKQFQNSEIMQLIPLLAQIGETKLVKNFLIHVIRKNTDPYLWPLIANLAYAAKRKDYSIHTARHALRQGILLTNSGYPKLVYKIDPNLDPALINGLVRQESAFFNGAISRAGARGLMQLMPTTAYRMARKIRIRYSKSRLTRDPEYNLRLGQTYLKRLLARYNGSEILALAAYNAGPNAVNRWVRRLGPPGNSIFNRVDWIESIPFKETRNYVQRVLENKNVYQSKKTGKKIAMTLGLEEFNIVRVNANNRLGTGADASARKLIPAPVSPDSSGGISTLFEDEIRRNHKKNFHGKTSEKTLLDIFEENSDEDSDVFFDRFFK